MTQVAFRGVNLVGGGAQGSWEKWEGANVATRSPGQGPRIPEDFQFPTFADVDYLVSKGANIFRLLFSHEAIQPEAFAAIPYVGSLPNASRYTAYFQAFKDLADYITNTKGCVCVIDSHSAEGQYPTGWCSYYLQQFSMSPSSTQCSGGVLANLCWNLAKIFKGNSKIWFGLINEPTIPSQNWYPVAQACIDAIRTTGNTSKICVPSHDASGARSFVDGGSETLFAGLKDPANNLAVQVHNYFDPNNSGTEEIGVNTGSYFPDKIAGVTATKTQIGVARLTAICNWARKNNKQIFLGEFALSCKDQNGVDQTSQATATLKATIDFMNANADVFIGWTWWEYGPQGWGGNAFDLRQTADGNKRMAMLAPFLAKEAPATSSTPSNPSSIVSGKISNYWVRVPTGYAHSKPTPLFVWLHGCGGYSVNDVNMVANNGYIAIAVDGRENECWSSEAVDGPKVLAAIADVRTRYNIDPSAIYIGGYSSGGDIGYPLLFNHTDLFAGGYFENTAPNAAAITSAGKAAKKPKVAHLAHTSDNTYPIASVKAAMKALTDAGVPVTFIERAGGHWDNDVGNFGTSYDLRNDLLPLINAMVPPPPPPPPPVDPTIDLKLQIAKLTESLALTKQELDKTKADLYAANTNLSNAIVKLNNIKAIVNS